jgi:hypothetical protein
MICFSHLFVLSSLTQLLFVIVDELPIAGIVTLTCRLLRLTKTNELAAGEQYGAHTHGDTGTHAVIHSIESKWSEKERLVITSTASSTGLDSLLFFCFPILFPFSIWFGSVSFLLLLLFLTICLFFSSFLISFLLGYIPSFPRLWR